MQVSNNIKINQYQNSTQKISFGEEKYKKPPYKSYSILAEQAMEMHEVLPDLYPEPILEEYDYNPHNHYEFIDLKEVLHTPIKDFTELAEKLNTVYRNFIKNKIRP